MAGLVVFSTLAEAIRMGFEIYDRTTDGYIVRKQTNGGWALAIVAAKERSGISTHASNLL
jgi:hypothetical protein